MSGIPRLLFVVTALSIWGTPAAAQRLRVGSSLDDYARLLQLTGVAPASPLLIRPVPLRHVLDRVDSTAAHPWQSRYAFGATTEQRGEVSLFRPTADAYWNSAYPAGQNDGAVWQGRGTTVRLSAVSAVSSWIQTMNRSSSCAARSVCE